MSDHTHRATHGPGVSLKPYRGPSKAIFRLLQIALDLAPRTIVILKLEVTRPNRARLHVVCRRQGDATILQAMLNRRAALYNWKVIER